MATSLLRIGRLGVLKNIWRESVCVQRSVPAALYCTHGEEPVKPATRTKTAVETAEAPGDRATLLAYKTTIAFPPRLSDSLSVAEPAGSSPSAQTNGAAPVAAATEAAITEQKVVEPVVTSADQAPDPDVAPVVADAAAAVVAAAPAPDPDVAPVVADAAATVVDAAPAPDPDVAPVVADAAATVVVAAPALDPDVAPVVADAAATVVAAAPPAAQTSGGSLAAEDTSVAAVPDDGLPSTAASSELGDTAADDSSSSSSSTSDSDSDSDSDDEKSHIETPAKAFPPADSTVDVTIADVPENTEGQKELESPYAFHAENIHEAATPFKAAQVNTEVPLGSSEELVDSAPNISTTAEDVPDVTSQEASAESREECAPEVLKDGESSVVSDTQLEPPPEIKADAAESLTAFLGETSEPVGAAHVPVNAAADTPIEAAADAPMEAADVPVKAADVPVEAAANVPIEAAADAPMEAANVPAETANVPVEAADVLVEAADANVEAADAPVKAADAPIEAAADAPMEAADAPIETADAPIEAGAAAETSSVEASPGPVESEAVAAEALTCADSAEELVDAALVITEATGEELEAEAPAEQPEEAALSPPEPEEPFDNSTYKNYQHHTYNPYTFSDLDLEMAKFRLPQPSSGRPSPRH